MGFWSRVFGRAKASPGTEPSTASANAGRASASRVFPDVPLHPLNPTPVGSTIEGEYLGNIGAVGLAICNEFRSGKGRMKRGWPDYADGELAALERTFRKMLRKAGAQHNADVVLVRKLARQYVERLITSPEAHSKFMNAEWTCWHMSIDFANTIGYGGGIDTALDWAKNSAWLG
jgi:hypothetical protein